MPRNQHHHRRRPPGGTLFASADAMVAVRIAQMKIADAQRAVHDKAIYRPAAPVIIDDDRRPRTSKRISPQPPQDARPGTSVRISKKYRKERPWLSAREIRERVREDTREQAAGLSYRHAFGFNSTQTLENKDFKPTMRAMRRIEGDKVLSTPRAMAHLERVKLPPVEFKEPPKPVDFYGFGDVVKLTSATTGLQFGCLKNWAHDKEVEGTVLIGGRRWKGDCLVEFSGQRLWMAQNELEMIARNPEPRPNTAEELKVMNKRRAQERKKRMKAKRAAQLKYNLKMQEGDENVMATEEVEDFFRQIDEDDGGTLDTDEMRLLMRRLGQPSTGRAFQMIMEEMDGDGSGEVDLPEFMDWFKRAGKERREEITKYNDKRRDIREIFDTIDTDGSEEVDREELGILVATLGIKMSPSELDAAMKQMDGDGSGQVEFEEFFAWWTDASTEGFMNKSKERMSAVKNLFDTLDDDDSGSLSKAEIVQLAKSLGAALTRREIEIAMREMDKDKNDAVDFLEFYSWWNSAQDGVLAEAKLREEKRNAAWKKVAPIDGTYERKADGTEDVLSQHNRDNAIRRRIEEQGGGGPRLRRCTVREISATLGGGVGVTGGDEEEDETETLQMLLQCCEENDIEGAIMHLEGGLIGETEVDVNDDLLGVTPLMVAASHGYVELVEELLARDADVNLKDMDDTTAYQWAADARSGSTEKSGLDQNIDIVMSLMRKAGAKDSTSQHMENDGFDAAFDGTQGDKVTDDKLLKASENHELKMYMLKLDVQAAIDATTDAAEEEREQLLKANAHEHEEVVADLIKREDEIPMKEMKRRLERQESAQTKEEGAGTGKKKGDEGKGEGREVAAEPQRYAALSHLEVRAGAGKTSEKVGDLAEGAVIEVMSTEEVEGTTWVQFDQGWVSVRAGSGQVLLELVTTSESDLLISGAIGETEVAAIASSQKKIWAAQSASFASDAQHQLAHAEQQEKTAANKKLADGLAHGERLFAEAMSAEVWEISRIRKLEDTVDVEHLQKGSRK